MAFDVNVWASECLLKGNVICLQLNLTVTSLRLPLEVLRFLPHLDCLPGTWCNSKASALAAVGGPEGSPLGCIKT